MAESGLTITVVWADSDLLEIKSGVQFESWSGEERAFVTRDELTAFAAELDRVADGATSATLDAGQSDLGYMTCRVFEYGGPRHLAAEVVVGHSGNVSNGQDYPRQVRVSLPIERGQLPGFAASLRNIVRTERGVACLAAPPNWSS